MIVHTMPPQVMTHEVVAPCSHVPGVRLGRHTSQLGDSFVTIEVPDGRTIIRLLKTRDVKALHPALVAAFGRAMTAAFNAGMSVTGGPGRAKDAEDVDCSTSTRTPAASAVKSRRG
jgi:hypothetical protein